MKLINSILFFSTILLWIASEGQTCNERYDFYAGADVGFAIQENDSGYVVCAGIRDSSNYVRTALIFYDTACNVRYTKSYGEPYRSYYPGAGGTLIKTKDGGYALGGTIIDTGSIYYAVLMKFNSIGDTVWSKWFGGLNENWLGYQVKHTSDSGYVIVGMANINNNRNAFLIKTDNLGNEQWRNTYGTTDTEYGFSVMITSDNHYLIGGTTCSTCTSDDGDMAVFKVNSSGGFVWKKQFGNPLEQEASANVGHEFPDGSYLFGGYWQFTMGKRMTVIRIDTNGNQIWKKDISGYSSGSASAQTVKTLNDSVALIGGFLNEWPGSLSGVIAKIDLNGNLLMKSDIDYDSNVSDLDAFNDVIITSSGGIAATGTTNDGQQDVWFVKTDEYGCIIPGCEQPEEFEDGNLEYLSSVEEINEENSLRIYPNPAGNYTILEFSAPGNYELTITSADGKIIEKTTFKSKSYSIDTGLFPNGIYFLNVWMGDKLKTGRLVVIK